MNKNDQRITTLDEPGAEGAEVVAETVAPAPASLGKKKTVGKGDVVVAGDGMSGRKLRVTIHQGQDDLGREPVFVGLNGYSYLIKRGEEVEVPEEVVAILQSAVQSHFENTKAGLIERKVPRHSMSVRAV